MDPSYAQDLARRHPASTWCGVQHALEWSRARPWDHWLRETGMQDVSSPWRRRQREAEYSASWAWRGCGAYSSIRTGDGGHRRRAVLAFLHARGRWIRERGDVSPGPRIHRRSDGGRSGGGGVEPIRSENVTRDVPGCSPAETRGAVLPARWSTARGRSETVRSFARHPTRR